MEKPFGGEGEEEGIERAAEADEANVPGVERGGHGRYLIGQRSDGWMHRNYGVELAGVGPVGQPQSMGGGGFHIRGTLKVSGETGDAIVQTSPEMGPSLITEILFNAKGMTEDGSHRLRSENGERAIRLEGQILLMQPDAPAADEWTRASRERSDRDGREIRFGRQERGRCVFISQKFQPCGVLGEQRGIDAGFQIGAADEVGFAASMQAGHPPP